MPLTTVEEDEPMQQQARPLAIYTLTMGGTREFPLTYTGLTAAQVTAWLEQQHPSNRKPEDDAADDHRGHPRSD